MAVLPVPQCPLSHDGQGLHVGWVEAPPRVSTALERSRWKPPAEGSSPPPPHSEAPQFYPVAGLFIALGGLRLTLPQGETATLRACHPDTRHGGTSWQ